MSLASLQKKIGVTADGAWGPGTLRAAATYYKLTPARAAHFFGQTAHETGGFKAFSENLNYGAKGLRGIFGKYFPTDAVALQYERNPSAVRLLAFSTANAATDLSGYNTLIPSSDLRAPVQAAIAAPTYDFPTLS